VFVAEKTPSAVETKAFADLDDRAAQGGLSIAKLPLAGQTVTAWTALKPIVPRDKQRAKQGIRLEADVKGVRTSVGDYEIFATSIAAMAQALDDAEPSLLKSNGFQQAIAALPTENDGYFYLNWHQGQDTLKKRLPAIAASERFAAPLLDHLQSVTLSSQGSDSGIIRTTVFFKLGENRTELP